MIQKIIFSAGWDTEFVFEIDTGKFTEEQAKEINDFWMASEQRLMMFNNDIRLAALSLYCASLFMIVVNHNPILSGVAYFFNQEQTEGFLPLHDEGKEETHLGIKLIDFSVTIPQATDFGADVEELTQTERTG